MSDDVVRKAARLLEADCETFGGALLRGLSVDALYTLRAMTMNELATRRAPGRAAREEAERCHLPGHCDLTRGHVGPCACTGHTAPTGGVNFFAPHLPERGA